MNSFSDPSLEPLSLAVLLSGGGRTMQNLAEVIARGELAARIAVVISSNPAAMGVIRAEKLGLPVRVVPRKTFADREAFSAAVWHHVREAGGQVVCLAGFLSLLSLPDEYAQRVLNIHPALLPAFGGQGMHGHHVHEAVLKAGVKVSGCTVHFCDQTYDTGPILVQRTCPVLEDDTPDELAGRVFEQECLAYPEALRLLAQGRMILDAAQHRTRVLSALPTGLVERAKRFSEMAHAGQKRDNGLPYAMHPAAVAQLVTRYGQRDPEVVAAAYLHDTIEDCAVSAFQLQRAFGPKVASLVQELTLIGQPGWTGADKSRALAEQARHMSEPARLIKLADRAHNLSELAARPAEKQAEYLRGTVELLEALKPWPSPALAELVQRSVQAHQRS